MTAPPDIVLDAFGVTGPARLLAGGQGTSWTAGGLVFKPEAGPLQQWLGETLGNVARDGFRLAAQARTRDGDWSRHGWSATEWVDAAAPDFSDVGVWAEILAAARAFHQAVAHLERPAFLDGRRDRWAEADRIVWAESDMPLRTALAARLCRALDGDEEPAQLIHGDLCGNILVTPMLPPVVIDVSPYWRPVSFAEGMIVADALCWHGAPADLHDRLTVPAPAVARGLLFRMVTDQIAGVSNLDRYEQVADALGY
ncbi:MAG TPA: TIGR02569 family protein [Actinoplanes sp.]|nr:TIGR02569 family protein [Actinoplanes sp.]